ncbi:MAG: hypothetical protein JXR64_03120 [Spirochaetales bacterium]|nr:hypothetical protein [Spirochaetales bacterium]
MRNKLLFIILILAFMGCDNSITNEKFISISFGSRSTQDHINNLGEVTEVELWISDTEIDYELVENPVEVTLLTQLTGVPQVIYANEDDSLVRYLKTTTGTVVFDISVGVTKNFTARVEYSDGSVFVGTTQATISKYTSNIDLVIHPTSTTINNWWFSDLDDYLKENW